MEETIVRDAVRLRGIEWLMNEQTPLTKVVNKVHYIMNN